MRFLLIVALLLSVSFTEALTIVPRVLSNAEAEYYLKQGTSTVEVDDNLAERIQRSLDPESYLESNFEGNTWNVPVSSFAPNSFRRRSLVKGSTSSSDDIENIAYVVLDKCKTDNVDIKKGALVVFDENEDPREIFPNQTKVLGPFKIFRSRITSRRLKQTEKKDKNSITDRDPSDYDTAAPTVAPTSAPTLSPTFSPTKMDETKLYYGPCVCKKQPQGCWRCQGAEDDQDCQGDCESSP